MARIVTITFNPCIDKSTVVSGIAPEKKLRCGMPKFEPGGGGINVSRAIRKLGGEALAIYPAGGHTGIFLGELLKNEDIPFKVVPTESRTRENFIVLDEFTNEQYRFGLPGFPLGEEEWEEVLRLLEEEEGVEYIVASGSLSPDMPMDIFGRIAVIAHAKGARFVVDTSGPALDQAIKEGVFLLKPNLAELSALVGKEELQAELVDDVARQIISEGKCEMVAVSLGSAGAMLVTEQDAYHVVPPAVVRRSTVGAGDSMVAGIVLSLSRGWSPRDAPRYGVACGSAATMNSGTELCRIEDVERLYPLTRCQPVV